MYSCHRRGNHRKLKRTPCAGEIRRWRSSSSGKYQWGELADDDGANDLGLLPPPVVVGPDASGLRRMIDRVLLRRRGATRSRSPPPPAPAALVDQVRRRRLSSHRGLHPRVLLEHPRAQGSNQLFCSHSQACILVSSMDVFCNPNYYNIEHQNHLLPWKNSLLQMLTMNHLTKQPKFASSFPNDDS